MLALLVAATLTFDATVSAVLQARGLTRRESESIQHRHRRLVGKGLSMPVLDATLERLDSLQLVPGQVTHLLRSYPLASFERVDPDRDVWCSYKNHIWCSCTSAEVGSSLLLDSVTPPDVLSLDCEFKPLRCAIVDSAGSIRLDALVVEPRAGVSARPLPGILKCDQSSLQRVELAELQAALRRVVAAGTVLIAHTPKQDLRALQMLEDLEDHVVDIAQLGLPPGAQSMSLKRMAAAHLDMQIQQSGSGGSRRHCAIEDARVAMKLFHKLKVEHLEH